VKDPACQSKLFSSLDAAYLILSVYLLGSLAGWVFALHLMLASA